MQFELCTFFLILFLLHPAHSEVAISRDGDKTTFWYNSSNTQVATYIFDFCEIVHCYNRPWEWGCTWGRSNSANYQAYICVTSNYWGNYCGHWGSVGWNEAPGWGYRPEEALSRVDNNQESLLTRMSLVKKEKCDSKFILSIRHPQPTDAGTYVLSRYGSYNPQKSQFYLKDMYMNKEYRPAIPGLNSVVPHFSSFKHMIAIADPTFEETMEAETGFSDVNFWLEWMKYNVEKHNKSNCYVCSKARPHLGTVPLNIPADQEDCFLSLYTNTHHNDTKCEMWKREYPILSKNPNPGNTITIYPGNYTCYVSNTTHGRDVKHFPPGYCLEKRYKNLANQTRSLGDIYWICGDMKIRTKLDTPWKGECALAKIIMPLHIIPESETPQIPSQTTRRKREVPKGSFDAHVYIDAIGVPRGVPDDFKARDEVQAGFESLLPAITINKNVAWINYIYYNQQRFVNDTRDAVKGIAEQLEATSQMTFQNRMALDMILAEKGGTCVYIGKVEGCCTFIPDNTGPNGKVTLAIKKLEDLSIELKENSGINNPWSQYFGWFENWKQALVQLGLIILIVFATAAVVIYCIIPCCKKLANKGAAVTMMYETSVLMSDNSPEGYHKYLARYRSGKRGQNHII